MSPPRRARQSRASLPRAVALAVVSLGIFAAGCSSTGGGSSSQVGHYTVRVATPMFRYGPAQSFGPDFSLAQGQHVIMLRKEFGYSRVMTDDGQSGYVASEDLVLAPPPPPAPKTSSSGFARVPYTGRGSGRPGVSSANAQVIQSGPLFGEGELPPLPEKDPLQPPTRPGFRVNIPSNSSSGPTAPTPSSSAETKKKPGFRVRVKSDESR